MDVEDKVITIVTTETADGYTQNKHMHKSRVISYLLDSLTLFHGAIHVEKG